MLRIVGAVLAGVVTIVVLSTATDAIMHASGVFPPEGASMPNHLWILATAYRAVYQIAGGYLTASIARERAMTAVAVLAGLGVILGAAGVAATWNRGPAFGPRWYSVLIVVLAAPTVWLGGRLKAPGQRQESFHAHQA